VAKKLIGDAVKTLFEATFPPVEGPRTRAESRRRPRSGELDDDDLSGPTTLERAEGRRTASAAAAAAPGPYDDIVAAFTNERKIVLSDATPFSEHLKTLESVKGLSDFVLKHAKPRDHYERAFLMELVLEGLVQNLRIAREDLDSTLTYAELAKFNLMRSRG
jgi:hypothetical protein